MDPHLLIVFKEMFHMLVIKTSRFPSIQIIFLVIFRCTILVSLSVFFTRAEQKEKHNWLISSRFSFSVFSTQPCKALLDFRPFDFLFTSEFSGLTKPS